VDDEPNLLATLERNLFDQFDVVADQLWDGSGLMKGEEGRKKQ
jgi:hypothetical protein